MAVEHRGWSREELIHALALYCQIPFGTMHSGNPRVVALAKAIERTPSAVALKLVNFASLDPDHQKRGVSGMGNVSAADRSVWDEFFGKWEALVERAGTLAGSLESEGVAAGSPVLEPSFAGSTERLSEVVVRRGQTFFRTAVLAAHRRCCCITGITSEPMLRASHIVPWSQSASLRLDPRNGLCLNALHDAAFDRGLITLSDNLELKLSGRVKSEVPAGIFREMFDTHSGRPIRMPERFGPLAEALEYHRTKVFCA